MHLHLPLSLRSALIKLLVTTSLIPAFGTSFSYGADQLIFSYDESTKALTVSSPDPVVADTRINGLIQNNANYTQAEKIIFNLSDPGSQAVWFADNWNVTKDIQIGTEGATDTGLRLNNGSSNATLDLQGTVTGSGLISLSGGANKKMIISGDASNFTGNILMNNSGTSYTYLQFGNGGAATGSETQGVAGTGTISLNSASKDYIQFNYASGTPAYVTNTITGAGTISNLGAAEVILTKNITSNLTFTGQNNSGNINLNGAISAGTLTFSSITANINGDITSNLAIAGTGNVNITSALNTNTITVNAQASGTHTFSKGGTVANLYLRDGTNNLYGDFSISGSLQGGSASSTTINIGGTGSGQTANVTVTNLYGHYEYATEGEGGNLSTVNVNSGSTLNVTSLIQIARDGKGILNIAGGTVIASQIDMGTYQSNWTGTADKGKKATLNLNSGTLILGSAGITQVNNAEQSPGVLNLNAGTLGGSADWSTSLAVTAGNSNSSSLIVNTNAYSGNDFSTSAITISLGKLTASDGNSLDIQGNGTLKLGTESSLKTLTLSGGYLAINSSDHTGTASIETLNSMTSGGGSFWINLGTTDGNSDKFTASSYNGTLNLAISGGASGNTYSVFQADSALTKDSVNVTSFMDRGLTASTSVDSGLVKITISGAASTTYYDLIWNGTSSQSWANSTETAWTNNGTADRFSSNDRVTFNGGGIADVNITGNVAPGSITVNADTDYTFQGTGSITGSGALTKDGSGTLTMATQNAYTGGTTITNGKVVVANTSALGTGAITVAENGTLGITTSGNTSSIFAGVIPTLNSGTLEINSGASVTLDQVLAGSAIKLNVSGENTALNISSLQTNTSKSSVSDGATLTLSGNSGTSTLAGDLDVTNATIITTGDGFGHSNSATDGFGTLTMTNSDWNVTNSNCTLSSMTIVLDKSRIVMNVGSNASHGLDLYKGTNTIRTTSSATGMSEIKTADGITSSGNHNALNLRKGDNADPVLDIARGNFELNDDNTSDLKISVNIATKESYTGSLTKSGDGVLELSFANTFVNNFAITNGTVLLSGVGTLGSGAGTVTMGGSGDTFLTFNHTSDVTLANVITGSGTVTQKGSANVTMSGANTYSGTTTIQSGTLTVGNNSAFGTSSVDISGGTLAVVAFTVSNDVTVLAGTSDVHTTAGITSSSGTLSNLSLKEYSDLSITGETNWSDGAAISLGENSTLSYYSSDGVLGDLDWSNQSVTLTMTSANVTATESSSTGSPMIKADSLTLTGANTTLDLSNQELVTLLTNIKSGSATAKLAVTSGTLTFADAGDHEAYKKQLLDESGILAQLGFAVSGIEGGNILLNGALVDTSDIYVVTSDADDSFPHTISSYSSLDPYKAVVLDSNQSLQVELNGAPEDGDAENGLTVRNLVGVSGSSLNVTNTDTTSDANAVVILDNTTEPVTDTPVGTNTSMDGDLTSSGNVVFLKQGAGTLSLNGSVSADTIQVNEGGLAMNGQTSLQSLVLNGNSTQVKVSVGGTTTTSLSESDELNGSDGAGADLTIDEAGALELTGDNVLEKSDISGSGSLIIGSDASLELSDTASISGVNAEVNGELTLNSNDASLYSVSTLNGNGTIKLAAADGGTLTVNGTGSGVFSGNIEGSGTLNLQNGSLELNSAGNGDLFLDVNKAKVTLTEGSGTSLTAADASSGIEYNGIGISNGGTLNLGSSSQPDQKLSLGSQGLTLNGGTINIQLATESEEAFGAAMPLITTSGKIDLQSGTLNLLNDNSLVAAENESFTVTLMEGGEEAALGNVSFSAGFLSTVYDLSLSAVGNNIVLTGVAIDDNIFDTGNLTPNAQAGADLLWGARFSLKGSDSVLKDAYLSVFNLVDAGKTAEANKVMAAIAGSTINATGTAQRDALRSQLSLVRDRTTQMGVNPAYVNADLPYFHLWLEGTGSFAKLNTDGDEGGYKLNTWGGTVGMDVDLSDRLTIGAALSANYGDLSASAAEVATGSLDSYYVSLFGRYQSKRWAHTLILTGGWNNADLNRTVHYGSGSYSTQGSTNGYGIGAMYEVTYDVALNESKSSILQPLANLSVVHTGLDAYTESGAGNAGLNVGKQEWTTATVALGARWLGLVGSNIFGREALAELRVNAAQDMGDSQGKTDVSLIGKPGFTQTVRGAKVGTTALQVGAGLSIPVGLQSTIYCNGNADIRSGASALNATLGLRYNF